MGKLNTGFWSRLASVHDLYCFAWIEVNVSPKQDIMISLPGPWWAWWTVRCSAETQTIPSTAVSQSSFRSEKNTIWVYRVEDLTEIWKWKFQCMSIAYRQKLTSPKWNRFLGMKLRWKDKIRLNNVIWRCWHMQFIKVIILNCAHRVTIIIQIIIIIIRDTVS